MSSVPSTCPLPHPCPSSTECCAAEPRLPAGSGLEQDREGAVVREPHPHHGAEPPGADGDPALPDRLDHLVHQRLGDRAWGGAAPGGPAPLARVAVERELGD